MRLAIARAVMAVAVRCMGDCRLEWACAMEAEFDAAVEGGEPLHFAFGCLVAAWREMPTHEEGRFVLASHVLAMGILLPVAVLLLTSVARGLPFLAPEHTTAAGLLGNGWPSFPISAFDPLRMLAGLKII